MCDYPTAPGAYDPTVANGPLFTAAQEQEKKKFYDRGASPGGPRLGDAYAQAKQDYYANPLLNELQARRRTLEARKNQLAIDLDVIYALLRTLVD